MMRLLLLLLIFAVFLALLTRRRPRAAPGTKPVTMSACKLCGLHVPREQAIISENSGALYCCADHARMGDGQK